MAPAEEQQQPQPPHPDTVARILQRVPTKHRLGSCALVCKAWAEAAPAVTTVVKYGASRHKERQTAALHRWLTRHGGNVLRLDIFCDITTVPRPVALPTSLLQHLPRLRDLVLTYVQLQEEPQAAAAPGGSNGLSALTALTQLYMRDCRLAGFRELGYGPLGALSSLQRLTLASFDASNTDWLQLDATLPRLAQLTFLNLNNLPEQSGPFRELGRLSSLQELHLSVQASNSGSLAALPASLTRLSLLHLHVDFEINPTTAPGLTGLTALQRLSIQGSFFGPIEMETDVVAGLSPATLLPLQRLQRLDLHAMGDAFTADFCNAAAPHMGQLQELVLGFHSIAAADAPALARLACLTQLTHLALHSVDDLPPEAGEHLFSGRFPRLRELLLNKSSDDLGHLMSEWTGPGGMLDTAGLSRLVEAAPGLTKLNLTQAVQPGIALDCLSQLSTLKDLEVDGRPGVSVDNLAALARLTQLERLVLQSGEKLYTAVGLLPLAALRQLRELRSEVEEQPDDDVFDDEDEDGGMWGDYDMEPFFRYDFHFQRSNDEGGPPNPPVWEQLLAYIAETSSKEAAGLQKQVADLQHRLAEL